MKKPITEKVIKALNPCNNRLANYLNHYAAHFAYYAAHPGRGRKNQELLNLRIIAKYWK